MLGVWAASRPWRERFDALTAAGRGLFAAHSAGIIHRDFKPDNVMVSRRGDVKVMDFGLARGAADTDETLAIGACASCAPADQVAQIRDLSATVGTPRYMAPELFEGVAADTRSDQFAFAVSCWEILHGVPPFPGDAPADLYFAKKMGVPAAPAAGDVPAAVTQVLERALRPSPSRRYVSLAEMIARLEGASMR